MQELYFCCHSEERSDEETTISPCPGADRGRLNGIVAAIRPSLSVIPSVARNLKSITARPDGQSRDCIVTEIQTGVRILRVSFTLGHFGFFDSAALRSE